MRRIIIGTMMLATTLDAYADTGVTIGTDFPGGNALVKSIEGDTVSIAPDLAGGRNWFYWCIEARVKQPGTVTFSLPGGKIGNQGPAISRDQGKTWEYMGKSTVEGNTFTYRFTKSNDPVRLAVTIPYLQKDLDAFLKKNARNPHLSRGILTRSKAGRDVELLRIGRPGPGIEPVCFTCRHHACETLASFLVEGFMQAAIDETPEGQAFRSKYVLYVIPFVDKDGVEEGDQGKGRTPHDHNRDYGKGSIFPEVDAIEKLAVDKKIRYQVDWHCPTLLMGSHQLYYFCGPKLIPPANYENVQKWSDQIKEAMPKAAPAGPAVWLKPVKYKTSGDLCSGFHAFLPGMVMATALEVPFAPPGKDMSPGSVRSYGKGFLTAWTRTEFSDPPQYALKVAAATLTPIGAQVSRDGQYAEGTVVQLVANPPPAGRVFDAWSGDVRTIANVYDPTVTVTMPGSDTTLTATYKRPGTFYPLTVTRGTGTGKYSLNAVVDIAADTAPVGQAFHRWDGAGFDDPESPATSITMPARAVTISAQYRSIEKALLGWWTFDEQGPSILNDSCSHANHLQAKGTPSPEPARPGARGQAIRFDGVSDSATHPTLLDTMPRELTIACWVKPDATGHNGQQRFLMKTNRNVYDQFFCTFLMKSEGVPDRIKFIYRSHGPGMSTLDSGMVWKDDVWYHYAITWGSAGVTLFVDGEVRATHRSARLIGDGNQQPFTIGSGFKGAMDELRVYGVGLKEAEIKLLAER